MSIEQQFFEGLQKLAAATPTNEKAPRLTGEEPYEDPSDVPERLTTGVHFSPTAQSNSADVRAGVAGRLLAGKARSDAVQRGIVGAVLKTKDYETSSIQLKPITKVSSARPPTLIERVTQLLGRP